MVLDSNIADLKEHGNNKQLFPNILVFDPQLNAWGTFAYAWLNCPNNQGKDFDPDMAFTSSDEIKPPKFVPVAATEKVENYTAAKSKEMVQNSGIVASFAKNATFKTVATEIAKQGYYFVKSKEQ